MICKNCSHENAPEEKVCTNCGAPLTDDEAVEAVNTEAAVTEDEAACEPVIEDVADDAESDEVISNEIISDEIISDTDVADDFAEETEDEAEAPKKKSKLVAFSGLIALVVICIGLWVAFTGVFAPKYDVPVDRSKYSVSYVKDFALYQKPVSGSAAKVSEALVSDTASSFSSYSYTVKQSKDGKTTYFLENFDQSTFSGSLFVTYNGKDKVKIADNVLQGFAISENGKTVVYMTDVNIDTATGTLSYYSKGGKTQTIANSTLYQTYMISENGNVIAYLDNVDAESGAGEYYVTKVGGTPAKIDDSVIAGVKVSDKGEVLYVKNMNETTYTCDLYTASLSKAPELISSGVTENYVMASKFSNKVSYVTVDENQVYNFNTKSGNAAPSVVMDDLMGFFAVDVENGNFLLAKMGADADPSSASPDMLLKRKGKDAVTIANGLATPQHASASYDFKTIYYLSDFDQTASTGTLHVRKESFFGSAKDEVIAEGVSSFTAAKDGKVVVFVTNMDATAGTGTLSAYSNGKTKVLGESIFTSAYKLSQNGKTVTYVGDMNAETYVGTLYSIATTGGSAAKTIDTEVYASFYTRSDKNAIYLKNFNSETNTADLYMWKGRGTPEAVDTGVTTVLFE